MLRGRGRVMGGSLVYLEEGRSAMKSTDRVPDVGLQTG